jgi:hypothetical protein
VDDIVDEDNDSSRGSSAQNSPDHSRRDNNVHSAAAAALEEGERDDPLDWDTSLDWTLPVNVARERQALTTIRESREMGGRHRGSAPSADDRSASAAGGRPGGSSRVGSASSTVRQALAPASPARSAARTRPTSAELPLSSGPTTRLHKEQRPASASLLQGPKGLAQMVRAEHEVANHPNAWPRVEYKPSPRKSRPASAVSAKVDQTEDAAAALAERPAPAFHQKASKPRDEKEIAQEVPSRSVFDKKSIQKRNEQLHAAYGARYASLKGSSSRAPADPQKASASVRANLPMVMSRPPREGRLQAAKKAVHSPQVRDQHGKREIIPPQGGGWFAAHEGVGWWPASSRCGFAPAGQSI